MPFSVFELFWLFFLVSAFLPALRQRRVEMARVALLQALQRKRGSRVITLIHRQESFSFLGLFARRHISIEDSEQVLRAIRLTPPNVPLDLILHTPGGLVLASEQIAQALRRHPARVTVFVPHYAMSGGTMVALAADEIWLDENAVLGPVDPQLGNYPAASILEVLEQKDRNRVDDQTLILADIARKAIHQVQTFIRGVLEDRLPPEDAERVARALTEGRWTHDYPIGCDELRGLGLPIRCGLPPEIYRLMALYPQPPQRRPTVQFVPLPSREEGGAERP